MMNTFTAIFENVEDCYIGYVAELPGANVQEKTLEEARESLKDAIELILQANRELAEQEMIGKEVIRESISTTQTVKPPNSLLPYLKHLGRTPEEQMEKNQAAMAWAKSRLQEIEDKRNRS